MEAHDEGLTYRSTAPLKGFVLAELRDAGRVLPVEWKARELEHYQQTRLRVSPLLGWLEFHDRPDGDEWTGMSLSDDGWRGVGDVPEVASKHWIKSAVTLPKWSAHELQPYAAGVFTDTYSGYDLDDLAVQFILANDQPDEGSPVDGHWFRYDLTRARIGTMELDLELESPGRVTIAHCDRLTPDRRPSPVIALSASPTQMLQRFAVSNGRSRIRPLQSLGGRFIEVRVETDGAVGALSAQFSERDLLGPALGDFRSSDPLLDRIWQVGIDTLRSTTEDAVVDSIRERGEWLGDVGSAALPIMAASWGRVDPIRRTLLHAAALANRDGLVAGCGPGEVLYLSTYAAQWIRACLDLATAEDSNDILIQLYESGLANIQALATAIETSGTSRLPWGFVDWGYVPDSPDLDTAVIAHVVIAVSSWIEWLRRLGESQSLTEWQIRLHGIRGVLHRAIDADTDSYHGRVLGHLAGAVDQRSAVQAIIARYSRGFPFDLSALRMKNPLTVGPTATTPYFSNFSLPILLDAGEGERVREIWQAGWGWMLQNGATTWWEIFDERWSQCHSWSGAPTWQLSRYCLGLRPSLSGIPHLAVNTLGLDRAAGELFVGKSLVSVEWSLAVDFVEWVATVSGPPLVLRHGGSDLSISDRPVKVKLHRAQGDLYE